MNNDGSPPPAVTSHASPWQNDHGENDVPRRPKVNVPTSPQNQRVDTSFVVIDLTGDDDDECSTKEKADAVEETKGVTTPDDSSSSATAGGTKQATPGSNEPQQKVSSSNNGPEGASSAIGSSTNADDTASFEAVSTQHAHPLGSASESSPTNAEKKQRAPEQGSTNFLTCEGINTTRRDDVSKSTYEQLSEQGRSVSSLADEQTSETNSDSSSTWVETDKSQPPLSFSTCIDTTPNSAVVDEKHDTPPNATDAPGAATTFAEPVNSSIGRKKDRQDSPPTKTKPREGQAKRTSNDSATNAWVRATRARKAKTYPNYSDVHRTTDHAAHRMDQIVSVQTRERGAHPQTINTTNAVTKSTATSSGKAKAKKSENRTHGKAPRFEDPKVGDRVYVKWGRGQVSRVFTKFPSGWYMVHLHCLFASTTKYYWGKISKCCKTNDSTCYSIVFDDKDKGSQFPREDILTIAQCVHVWGEDYLKHCKDGKRVDRKLLGTGKRSLAPFRGEQAAFKKQKKYTRWTRCYAKWTETGRWFWGRVQRVWYEKEELFYSVCCTKESSVRSFVTA